MKNLLICSILLLFVTGCNSRYYEVTCPGHYEGRARYANTSRDGTYIVLPSGKTIKYSTTITCEVRSEL